MEAEKNIVDRQTDRIVELPAVNGGARVDEVDVAADGLIGQVEGVPIKYQDFSESYRQRLASYAQQSGTDISDATRDALREDTWNSLVTDILITDEIRKLGIDIPSDAVFDVLWNNPPSFVIDSPAFQDDEGNFSFDEYHRQIQLHPERWEAMADYYRSMLQRQILQRLSDPPQHVVPVVLVQHLAPAEENGELHFVALLKELSGVVDLDVQVVLVRLRAEANLLQRRDMMLALLVRFPQPTFLLILPFAVVHYPADRGIAGGGDLDEIQAGLSGSAEGLLFSDNTHLVVRLVN